RGNTVADKIASAAGRTMDALEYNFGIHIDHYAWVGLTGFVKVIDTAGGVDVDAIHPMVDDVYPNDTNNPNGSIYDYKRLYIAPGPQHMNGLQALEYVRTRHSDLVGDFGRSARQQQILAQLKAKLATPDTILKAPQLLNDLQGAVQTDLTLDQIYPLANFARTIDTNKIDRVTFSPPYSKPSGANTNYLPICEQIAPKIATMFALGVNAKCLPQVASSGSAATPAVASVAPTQSAATKQPTNATAAISLTNAWQIMGQLGSLSNMSLPQGSRGFAGTDSLHDLLDIMFLVVFESFDGMKV
ncbi:MAG TPA: LCP family protein, partial [Ktedonobacteraceae bacterium]|nr:LCP family protein [Ktedonobacteraceae bacterium]